MTRMVVLFEGPDTERLAKHLGKEMEAKIDISQIFWDWGQSRVPLTWCVWGEAEHGEDRGSLIGIHIDTDDEPLINTMAQYFGYRLNNEVTCLAMTRALEAYAQEPSIPELVSHAPMVFPDIVDLKYVRDRHGLIWRVVRDGGVVATCDYSGKNWSMGITALELGHGPLTPVEPAVDLDALIKHFEEVSDLKGLSTTGYAAMVTAKVLRMYQREQQA